MSKKQSKNKKAIPALNNSGATQDSEVILSKEKVAPVKKEETIKKAKKVNKERRPNKLGKMTKDTIAELKKVTWPTFPKVVKQTGVVLGVVIFFGLILFGFDYLLKFLFGLLIG